MLLYLIGNEINLISVNLFSVYKQAKITENDLQKAFPQDEDKKYFCFNNLDDAQECVARMRRDGLQDNNPKDKSKGDLFYDFSIFCISVNDELEIHESSSMTFKNYASASLSKYGQGIYNTANFNRYVEHDCKEGGVRFYEIASNIEYELQSAQLGSEDYDLLQNSTNKC